MEQRDYLFEPAFEPIFARCQELGYPLLFHPLDGEANFYSKRLVGPPSVTNWLGFTFEHATTALKFITTGRSTNSRGSRLCCHMAEARSRSSSRESSTASITWARLS